MWYDVNKIAKYGGLPYTVSEDKMACELFAQGRIIERNKRIRSTKLFEEDINRCLNDLDKIIEVAKGVDIHIWKIAKNLKNESGNNNQGWYKLFSPDSVEVIE